ncbi:MAG: AraC family transcriptional regulator [Fusicatenibacter sp.]
MNRSEFREKMIPLSDYERHAKIRLEEHITALDALNTQELWENDKNGYPIFSNEGMTKIRDRTDDKLHSPVLREGAEDHLRMIYHHRFSKIPMHSTEFISLNYVYSGNLVIHFPEQAHSLNLHAGQLLFMNSGIVHGLDINTEEDIILGFQIEKEFLNEQLLYGLSGASPIIDFLVRTMSGQTSDFTFLIAGFEEDERMKNLIEDVFCEYLDPGPLSDQIVVNYVRQLIIYLVRNQSSLVKLDTKADIMAILCYIEDHYRTCTLRELSEEFHFNSKYLGNLIRKKSGKTFEQILSQVRMEKAVFYLLNTDLPVSEIASMCGYSNLSFFYKKFKEKNGYLPKQYREMNRCV